MNAMIYSILPFILYLLYVIQGVSSDRHSILYVSSETVRLILPLILNDTILFIETFIVLLLYEVVLL